MAVIRLRIKEHGPAPVLDELQKTSSRVRRNLSHSYQNEAYVCVCVGKRLKNKPEFSRRRNSVGLELYTVELEVVRSLSLLI